MFHDLYQPHTGDCGTLEGKPQRGSTRVENSEAEKVEMLPSPMASCSSWTTSGKCMCISIHNADFLDVPGRVDQNTGEAISRSSCIIVYDKYMGAVDSCDQMIIYPTFKRRTLKWPIQVCVHMLMMATLNFYLLFIQGTLPEAETKTITTQSIHKRNCESTGSRDNSPTNSSARGYKSREI